LAQRFLETSNVDVSEELVNLIITQRAFEVNSKAITTADQLLEIANALKR
jgi:flagellar basal-body rod protein FlgG